MASPSGFEPPEGASCQYHIGHVYWELLIGMILGGFFYMMRSNSFFNGKVMYILLALFTAILSQQLLWQAYWTKGFDSSELYVVFFAAVGMFFGLSAFYYDSL